MITGNKGEWSEIYTLFKLLGDGKIHAADSNLNKLDSVYFPIIRVLREEVAKQIYEYKIDKKIQVYNEDVLLTEIDPSEFTSEATYLFNQILTGTGSFYISRTEAFMNSIGCLKIAAPSQDKTDILMEIHDIQTGYTSMTGFSIKSKLGTPATLVNASKATNFIFELVGASDEMCNDINLISTRSKLIDRLNYIKTNSIELKYLETNNTYFKSNLMLIDSNMNEILAYAIKYSYLSNVKSCLEIVELLEKENPLKYPDSGFYTYKFKKFLTAIALGMNPSKKWSGKDDANGGYIIVKADGDVLAYHLYNRNQFEDYLLKDTCFERGSTSKHDYADAYDIDGKKAINLNLQIRFNK
ncbi:HpaII family restriction endonuclease [Proteiniclasticum sp.]|uniref:HpaII family restriction endonuclease n=1 Tax=Proteiniclasticum sp. TaxID=2053595 RepID=UPI00289E0B1F|nr:HpaII family restriction endonuclease [Proteiniclasticum sp.]